jgi:hemoglobin
MSAETLITEMEIASLVERFYAKVRADPEIGPVFNDAVQNWDAHLALLKDFWSTVLLTTGRYTSVITLNPAIRDQVKSGHREWPKT